MDVVVIGGGAAGCAAAQRLSELGRGVTIVEAADHLGGRAFTLSEGSLSAETGGDTLLSSYRRTSQLIGKLGMRPSLKPFDHTSGVHDGVDLHTLRAGSPWSYAGTPLLGARDKARLVTGYLRASLIPPANMFDDIDIGRLRSDRSMAEWARDHLGEAALRYLIRPAIETRWYFRCDDLPSTLGLELLRRAPLTRFFCVAGGISTLLTRMAQSATVITGTKVDRIECRAGGVRVSANASEIVAGGAIIATDAPAAAGLLPRSLPGREAFARSRYSQSVRVLFGYQHNSWFHQYPASINPVMGEGYPIATVSLVSRKSSCLIPSGSEVVAVHLTGEASGRLSDREAVSAAEDAVGRFLPPAGDEPLFVRPVRWDRALPIPYPGQLRDLTSARDGLAPPLALAGDYFGLATIETAVRSGQRAADRLHAALF